MAASTFVELVTVLLKEHIAGTNFFYQVNITADRITQTSGLQVLLPKQIQYTSKKKSMSFFQLQKQIPYVKGWMDAIKIVK